MVGGLVCSHVWPLVNNSFLFFSFVGLILLHLYDYVFLFSTSCAMRPKLFGSILKIKGPKL